jgi:hypothetical protein
MMTEMVSIMMFEGIPSGIRAGLNARVPSHGKLARLLTSEFQVIENKYVATKSHLANPLRKLAR